ncbi:MAG: RecX family transcriptional regulator [Alphaproteobacteria bacterium]|nr:RecX family transcriptional regulator [Alphaproteobacteria bacterium]
MTEPEKQPKQRRRRVPRRATADRLERAALHYLERYASSAANLRRVLLARVDRSARFHGTDRETGAGWVEDIIARYLHAGLLDDRAYADLRAARLSARGYGRKRIAYSLRQKGVDQDTIAGALERLARDEADPDLMAAIRYARRRNLGPFRRRERAERREKDLAALARVGFNYDVARRVIDAGDVDDLEMQARDGS